MITWKTRKNLLENLSAAAVLGFIAATVSLTAILVERSSQAKEISMLSSLASSKQDGKPRKFADPAFDSIYPLNHGGKRLYATLAMVGDAHGQVRIAVFFDAEGKLDAVKVLDSLPGGLPYSREDWFSEFLGKGSADFPVLKSDLRKPDVVEGASLSLSYTSDVLSRVSDAVLAAAKMDGGK